MTSSTALPPHKLSSGTLARLTSRLGPWPRFLLKRLASLVIVLAMLLVLTFLLIHLVPGDPAVRKAGIDASAEQIEIERKALGLDQPAHIQFIRYIEGVARLDFGTSIHYQAVGYGDSAAALSAHIPAGGHRLANRDDGQCAAGHPRWRLDPRRTQPPSGSRLHVFDRHNQRHARIPDRDLPGIHICCDLELAARRHDSKVYRHHSAGDLCKFAPGRLIGARRPAGNAQRHGARLYPYGAQQTFTLGI